MSACLRCTFLMRPSTRTSAPACTLCTGSWPWASGRCISPCWASPSRSAVGCAVRSRRTSSWPSTTRSPIFPIGRCSTCAPKKRWIHACRTASRTALAIIDLDRFKEVNDTLGHHSGDEVLTKLAQRLADSTRPQDIVARLGGDEFGIILRDVSDAEEALRRLRSIIEGEIEISGLPLSIESSIGYVVAPDDGQNVDDLLQYADVAMYFAKAQHIAVAHYDRAQDQYEASNLSLIADRSETPSMRGSWCCITSRRRRSMTVR